MTARVLIIDDEANVRRMLRALLESEGYEVAETTVAAETSSVIDSFDPHVALVDLIMPGGPDGLEVLKTIKQQARHLVVIMMSGKASLNDAVKATKLDAFQFLEKPLTPEGVLVTVAAAYEVNRTRAENRALRAVLHGDSDIVGGSVEIQHIRQLITRVARTPTRVLITGESGTGKELIARGVHEQSDRAENPLVSLNCAAIPRELVESELFGHERGAFTGATTRRQGRFELADSGTIFLDEIGDLSLDAQAKLLRVLETGLIERVGGERTISVDVRVIAATNKDLTTACRRGTFREDLFYRLNVFPIAVPPLRERPDDVAMLVTHFAAEFAARSGDPPLDFTGGAMTKLSNHPWPGNVRELANVIERLTILRGTSPVDVADLEAVLGATHPSTHLAGVSHAGLTDALANLETSLIQNAMQRAGGNVTDAARILKTDRANLYRRMRRLRIDPTRKRV